MKSSWSGPCLGSAHLLQECLGESLRIGEHHHVRAGDVAEGTLVKEAGADDVDFVGVEKFDGDLDGFVDAAAVEGFVGLALDEEGRVGDQVDDGVAAISGVDVEGGAGRDGVGLGDLGCPVSTPCRCWFAPPWPTCSSRQSTRFSTATAASAGC